MCATGRTGTINIGNAMNKTEKTIVKVDPSSDGLFERVVAILERARANVVRAVGSNMVVAYWLIGQEIVQELQRG